MDNKRPFYAFAIGNIKAILQKLCCLQEIQLETLCDYRGQLITCFDIVNLCEIPPSRQNEVDEELRKLNVPEAIILIDSTINEIVNKQKSFSIGSGAYLSPNK
jgi:hypothetical protein